VEGRKWSVEEKLAIVLEGMRGERSVSEICREHGISQTQYYRWREEFLESGKQGLSGGSGSRELDELRREVERLQKLVGKQALQIEILKKRKRF